MRFTAFHAARFLARAGVGVPVSATMNGYGWITMSAEASTSDGHGADLLALYDEALPQVHGYLLKRCGNRPLAEDLTAEAFMGAVVAARNGSVQTVTTGWLIGIARNKLVDHWRREEREQRRLVAIAGELTDPADDWDVVLDQHLATTTLAVLGPHHRAALTLRYLDGLSVAEVAEHLDRTLHATEALLMRAKGAFRTAYDEQHRRNDEQHPQKDEQHRTNDEQDGQKGAGR